MKAFIKYGNIWRIEENKNIILDAKNCVFAENIEDAIDYINTHLNEHYPDFIIAHNIRGYKKEEINIFSQPTLRPDISAKRAIELIKEEGTVHTQNEQRLKKRWEEELNAKLEEFEIVMKYGFFEYNPKEAKKTTQSLKRKIKKPTKKKNFIRVDQIQRVNDSIITITNTILRQDLSRQQLYIEITDNHRYHYCHGNRKLSMCNRFFILKTFIDRFFGKNAYRHIKEFQDLKKSWKKEKPKSADLTGVTKQFFDFMEEEVKKRKPRKKEFKIRWK